MADRSSGQGLPDDWSRGSYPARERYYGAEPTDAHGPETAGSPPARAADPYGAQPTAAYGPGNADPSGAATADRYRSGNADLFAARGADHFGPRNADPFGTKTADAYGARAASAYGERTADVGSAGSARPDAEPLTAAIRPSAARGAAGSKGFLGALFDFGFTSFVTPRVIKVLYVLIMISTTVSALVFTIAAFKVSAVFGLLTLIIGDPLFIIIVMAIYRIILEFFVVIFRMSEDIRSLRERGDLR